MMTKLKLNELQATLIKRLLVSDDHFISVRAGWGSGKTSALVFALAVWSEAHPNKSSLLITDTAGRYRQVLAPEIQKWMIPEGWVYNGLNGCWTTPNNHVIYTRSYFRPGTQDASQNSLEGLNITSGLAVIDECQMLTEEVAFKALGRLRSGPTPKLVMVGLPVWGAWWVDMATKANCEPILFSSHVNKANLSSDWFEAIKNLPEEERLAMVENQPRPKSGMIYNEWTMNHIIDGWEYNPNWSGRIAIDFGFRKPSVLILVHDPNLRADIICAEINPQEITLNELAKLILSKAAPRALKDRFPNTILLDGACGDKAGAQRSDRTAQSSFRELKLDPNEGGIGMPFKWVTDPIRTDIMNGVLRVKRLIGQRKILCTREVWEAGERASGNSFRKAILSYAWDNKEAPKKDGREDPLDALRYDVINWLWRDSDLPSIIKSVEPVISSQIKYNSLFSKTKGF
jgi:hypothetical protein